MRDVILLILAGGALIFSVLAYERVEELSQVIYRLDTENRQEAFQRNRVITLGQQIEHMARSLLPGRKAAAPAQ